VKSDGHNGSVVTETMMPVNGIEVCVETFGEPDDPALLLIAGGASSMDWWEDEFCRRLAAGERFVIRYDHRDTGRSTSFPAGAPPYSAVDLAADALGVLDALGVHQAHLVGLSMGGGLAQRIAIEHPDRLLSLTLMSTGTVLSPAEPTAAKPSPAAPPQAKPGDSRPPPQPDWNDRRTAVNCLVTRLNALGGPFTADPPHLRRLAERVFDRTHDMAASQRNHWLVDRGPALADRLGEIAAATLILHGTADPMLAADHPRALADRIPGARLVWLEGVGHEFPPAAVWSTVIEEILAQAARGRQPA
jgi:pimeloyl-ACP methyl ester carboxylesterase